MGCAKVKDLVCQQFFVLLLFLVQRFSMIICSKRSHKFIPNEKHENYESFIMSIDFLAAIHHVYPSLAST